MGGRGAAGPLPSRRAGAAATLSDSPEGQLGTRGPRAPHAAWRSPIAAPTGPPAAAPRKRPCSKGAGRRDAPPPRSRPGRDPPAPRTRTGEEQSRGPSCWPGTRPPLLGCARARPGGTPESPIALSNAASTPPPLLLFFGGGVKSRPLAPVGGTTEPPARPRRLPRRAGAERKPAARGGAAGGHRAGAQSAGAEGEARGHGGPGAPRVNAPRCGRGGARGADVPRASPPPRPGLHRSRPAARRAGTRGVRARRGPGRSGRGALARARARARGVVASEHAARGILGRGGGTAQPIRGGAARPIRGGGGGEKTRLGPGKKHREGWGDSAVGRAFAFARGRLEFVSPHPRRSPEPRLGNS